MKANELMLEDRVLTQRFIDDNLKKKMQEMGIKSISIDYGKVVLENDKLVYDHKYAWRYYKEDIVAFEKASELLFKSESAINDFKAKANVRFETELEYVDFDNEHNNHLEPNYAWKSDFTDSGVEFTDGKVIGNLNQLRKFLSFASNHGRYSRSSYRFTNDVVNGLLEIGGKFGGLFEQYDSFAEYYHNAIVD